MTVKDLLAILENADDDSEVVVPSSDHSYSRVSLVSEETVGFNGSDYSEWFGEEHSYEGELPVRALVID